MKIGIVGNREGWDRIWVIAKLAFLGVTNKDIIISGGASGIDAYAEFFAKTLGCKMIIFYPDYDIPSPKRYFDRNLDIAKECDWLIAFDKGSSGGSGTLNTINHAKKLNKKVTVINDKDKIQTYNDKNSSY